MAVTGFFWHRIVRAVANKVFGIIFCMEAFAIPDARQRLTEAIDALVGEFIDGFSTQALGDDLVAIRRAADRLEAEFLRRLDRFDRAHGALADGAGSTPPGARSLRRDLEGGRVRVRLARTLASSRPRSTAPVPGAPP